MSNGMGRLTDLQVILTMLFQTQIMYRRMRF